MTTKEFKDFVQSKGYKIKICYKKHTVTVYDRPICTSEIYATSKFYKAMFPPIVIIHGTRITYSSKYPITDGFKHACEKYANTPLNHKISKRNNAEIQMLLRIKKRATDDASYQGIFNPQRSITLESLFSIIDSEINDLRS